jgi:hypothetical protein
MVFDMTAETSEASQEALPATRFGGYALLVLLVFVVLNTAAALTLPQNKFLRYQTPLDPQTPTAPWIYQRIHFDQTPIDIAFIGTSRTGVSVHTRRLENRLAVHGIHVKATNIYMIHSGINMQYVLAKELLTSRKVTLLVMEMTEREERKPHEDFIYLADPIDVVRAPMLINFNYLADFARLPGRQVDLFWQTERQRFSWGTSDQPLQPYQGSNLDHAEVMRTLDGVDHDRNTSHSLADMEKLSVEQDRLITAPLLPAFLSDLEFRFPRYYEDRILELAKAHGTTVLFLYTPRYGGPPLPPPYTRYASRAKIINPWPVLQDYRLWFDVTHVNWEGAKLLTDYLGDTLAKADEIGISLTSE